MTELQRLADQFRSRLRETDRCYLQGQFLLYALKQYRPGRKAERDAALRALNEFEAAWKR